MSTRRIVLGLDGSTGSRAALHWCLENAKPLDAEVIAVHVLDLSPLYFGPATIAALQPPIDEVRQARRKLLAEWAQPLTDEGIDHRTELVEGLARRALDDVAVREDADMIVVGRSGSDGFAELVLGSVPHALAHHAHRPLMIVPAGRSVA